MLVGKCLLPWETEFCFLQIIRCSHGHKAKGNIDIQGETKLTVSHGSPNIIIVFLSPRNWKKTHYFLYNSQLHF